MRNHEFAEVVSYFKDNREGQMELSGFLADYVAYKESQAKVESMMRIVKNLMNLHKYNADEAMEFIGLDEEERQELKKLLLRESES